MTDDEEVVLSPGLKSMTDTRLREWYHTVLNDLSIARMSHPDAGLKPTIPALDATLQAIKAEQERREIR